MRRLTGFSKQRTVILTERRSSHTRSGRRFRRETRPPTPEEPPKGSRRGAPSRNMRHFTLLWEKAARYQRRGASGTRDRAGPGSVSTLWRTVRSAGTLNCSESHRSARRRRAGGQGAQRQLRDHRAIPQGVDPQLHDVARGLPGHDRGSLAAAGSGRLGGPVRCPQLCDRRGRARNCPVTRPKPDDHLSRSERLMLPLQLKGGAGQASTPDDPPAGGEQADQIVIFLGRYIAYRHSNDAPLKQDEKARRPRCRWS